MHKIYLIVGLICLSFSLQAQGLIRKAVKSAQRNGSKIELSKTLLNGKKYSKLVKTLNRKTANAFLKQQAQILLLQNNILNLSLPTQINETQLYPLARAAAKLVNPKDKKAQLLMEKWLEKNIRYAQLYAQKINGTPNDMTAYYVAWLYANCLVHKANHPAYQLLENTLETKYGFLNYKELYHHQL